MTSKKPKKKPAKKPTKRKKSASKKAIAINRPKVTKLKLYLVGKGLTQKQLADNTRFSAHTINRLVKLGKANKSTIKMVADELDITEIQLKELLKFSDEQVVPTEPAEAPSRTSEAVNSNP